MQAIDLDLSKYDECFLLKKILLFQEWKIDDLTHVNGEYL